MKMPPLAWRPWPAHWPPSPTMRKRVCPAFGTSARRTTPAADQRPLIPCPSIRPEYCDEPANESTALPGPAAHRWPVVRCRRRAPARAPIAGARPTGGGLCRGRRAGRTARHRRRPAGFRQRPVAAAQGGRTGAHFAPCGRRHPGAQACAGPHGVAGKWQAAGPIAGRDRGRRRPVAVRGQLGPQPARRQLQHAGHSDIGAGAARADRRGEHHHPLELPVPDRQPETAVCAGCGLHRRGEACRGSTAVGKHAVARSAATLKKVALELGGKNPQIVFADCDWEAAVDAAVYGIFFNAGQCCNSGSRILVQDAVADKFAEAVIARSRQVRVGDPFDERTQVGAITTERQLHTILAHVEGARQAGATVALGGARLDRPGLYMEPTVLTGVTRDMAIARQEVFGPVLSILRFGTLDEAIDLANSTLYGLSAAVWSQDINTCITAARRIKAGTVWVNTFLEGHAELPFGGYRESGIGRELGRFAAEDYTETKTVHLHLGARTDWYLPPT